MSPALASEILGFSFETDKPSYKSTLNAGIRDQFRLNTFPPASTTAPATPPTPPAIPHP